MPTKIPAGFSVETDKTIVKFIWTCKGHWLVRTLKKERNKVEEHTLSYFKSYYVTTAIKTVCVCVSIVNETFDKVTEAVQQRDHSLYNWYWNHRIAISKKWNTLPHTGHKI